jgi:hypothetical protein
MVGNMAQDWTGFDPRFKRMPVFTGRARGGARAACRVGALARAEVERHAGAAPCGDAEQRGVELGVDG